MRNMRLWVVFLAGLFLYGTGWAQLSLGPIGLVAGSPIGQGGDVGQYSALAIDAFGGNHIVYYDATYQRLKYAHRARPTYPWIIEIVDAGPDAGRFASLALRSPQDVFFFGDYQNGSTSVTVHVPYGITRNRVIGGRIQDFHQATWFEIADMPSTDVLTLTTPYTGPTGPLEQSTLEFFQPVIAYQKTASNLGTSLNMALPQFSGQFALTQVEPLSGVQVQSTDRKGYYTSVDITTTGTVHVAWQDRDASTNPAGTLHHAVTQTTATGISSFAYDIPDPALGAGTNVRLSINPNTNLPSIMYRNDTTQDLWFANLLANGLWQVGEFDNHLNPGTALDMKFWPWANAFVSAFQRGDPIPQVTEACASEVGATSISMTQIIDVLTSGTGKADAIAVATGAGPLDLYHLYYDSANHFLQFDQTTGVAHVFTPPVVLDSHVDPGQYVSAGVNPLNSKMEASYYDAGAQALKFATYDSTTSSTEYVDGAKFGSFSSIGRTSTEVVVAYKNDVDGSVHVARWPIGSQPGGIGFSDTAVDTSSPALGDYVSMVIDGNNRIYVAYLDRHYLKVRLAIFNASNWYLHDLDATTTAAQVIGDNLRLVINPAKTQITAVYYDKILRSLKYVTSNLPAVAPGDVAITSTTQPLGNPAGTGRFVSAVYDSDGSTLHLAYYDENTFGLDYALFSSGTFSAVPVEGGVFAAVGWYTAITLNPLTGLPMIAYYDISNGTLKFAEQAGTGWDTFTVDNQSDTGYDPVILADAAADVVYIDYYDPTQGQMRVAERALSGGSWLGPFTLTTQFSGARPSGLLTPDHHLQLSFYDEMQGDLLTAETNTSQSLNAVRRVWSLYR